MLNSPYFCRELRKMSLNLSAAAVVLGALRVNWYFYREDPDEMPHHVAFHQGLHCLLK